jgi:hypothetical protein
MIVIIMKYSLHFLMMYNICMQAYDNINTKSEVAVY